MKNKFNYIFFLSFFFIKLSASQDYAYKNYTTKDGLAGNHVYHSVQDKEGYLWFATETGVSRFDGKNFVNFTVEQGLPSNEILRMFVDSKGRVWMMPFANKICYYFKGKIYNSNNDDLIKKIKIKAFILDLKEDKHGNLFFIEQLNGLFAINNKGDVFYYNKEICCVAIGLNQQGDLNLFAILGNNEGFSKHARIYSLEIKSRLLSLKNIYTNIQFKIDKVSQCLIGKNLFVYSNRKRNSESIGDLCFFSIEYGVKNKKINQDLNSIYQVNDSVCFINTTSGLIKYDFKSDIYEERMLKDENILYSFSDNENTNWILTSSNGVYKSRTINLINYQIPYYLKKNDNIHSLAFIDGKKYCISSQAKMFEIEKSNELKLIKKLPVNSKQYVKKYKVLDGQSYLLLEHDLIHLDLKRLNNTNKIKYYPLFSLKDFVFDKKRGYFFSSHLGVFNSGLKNSNSKNFYCNERTTCLALIDSGIFFGTLSGLKFVNWEKQILDYSESLKIKTETINCLTVNKNILWIGTSQNGLIGYDFKNKSIVFSGQNLFPGNSIRCLYLDSKYLWVGTNVGLSKIRIDSSDFKLVKSYTTKDGLSSDVINDILRIGSDVFVATDKGCSLINLNENIGTSSSFLPFPKITIANKEYTRTNEITVLDPNQSISFEFNAIALKSEGDLIYNYRIVNLDSNWKSTQNSIVDLEYLPSGNFVFEMLCIDHFSNKSNVVRVPIYVKKVWYKRFGFLFFLFFSIFISFYFYFKALRKKNERIFKSKLQNAQKIMSLEQETLKAQMNPHFIFNCLNAIQHYIIEKDVISANKFISSFAGLIRQALDNSGRKSISIKEEITFLKSYIQVEQNRFEDKFIYQINVDDDIEADLIQIPPMLIQPFVENAINHGLLHKRNEIGKLEIDFSLSEQMLKIIISDNGIGRLASRSFSIRKDLLHVSKGIELTEMRISKLNYLETNKIMLKIEDKFDVNGNPIGTKVEILIPLIFNN